MIWKMIWIKMNVIKIKSTSKLYDRTNMMWKINLNKMHENSWNEHVRRNFFSKKQGGAVSVTPQISNINLLILLLDDIGTITIISIGC